MTRARYAGAKASALALGLAWAAALGCAGCGQDPLDKTLDELQKSRRENVALTQQVQDLQTSRAQEEKRIQTLMGLGEKRLDMLFTVKGLEFGRYSGGIAEAGKTGDVGIRVYLKPLDRDGTVIKASGAVKIQFFDLAKPTDNLIGTYEFPAQELGKHWESGFISYHYTFDCKWQKPPSHPDITLRASFTDYLTGETFSAQEQIHVNLPDANQPASSEPASQATSQAGK